MDRRFNLCALRTDQRSDRYSPIQKIGARIRKYGNRHVHLVSAPKFLDKEYRPVAVTVGPGPRSVSALVRAARVPISATVALELMQRSPSIGVDVVGNLVAQRREFVLPNFAVPRAALVIERYLDTLRRNSASNKKKSVLLLERNCHVPQVNLNTIAPILRDIKKRGSAYIDSVNGDLEGLRRKRSRRKGSGEMSVHILPGRNWTSRRNIRATD